MKRPFAGGYKQRAQKCAGHAEASGSAVGVGLLTRGARGASRLANGLIRMFVWGLKSGVDVQRTCEWAAGDGLDHPDVVRLSKVRPHAAQGDILEMLKPSPYSQCIVHADFSFKKQTRFGCESHSQDILAPHALFSQMYHTQKDQFLLRFCGGSETKIEDFWDAMQGNPQLEDNDDIKGREDYRTKCCPLSLHGDGLSIVGIKKSWQKCADLFSFCGVLGTGQGLLHIKRERSSEKGCLHVIQRGLSQHGTQGYIQRVNSTVKFH